MGFLQRFSGTLNSPLDLKYLQVSATYSASQYDSYTGETDSRQKSIDVNASTKKYKIYSGAQSI